MLSMARRASDRKTQEFSKAFAARLRALRTERGWTQAELGKMIGMDGSGIRSYELKLHHPPLMTLQRLAAVFGVSVDFLLTGVSASSDSFQDRELLELFLKADALHYTRRNVLKQVIEGLMAAEQLQKAS